MNDAEICAFVEKAIYEEIIPVLDLPRDELESFASAVTGRFRNPYIKHQLLSIALNGMTKFRTRILPQLLAGQKAKGTLPARLTFALAALIAFYRGERNGETYPVQDDAHWLERYQQLWSQHRDRVIGTQELVAIVLAEKDHWEQDLTQVPGLVEQVANDLDAILEKGCAKLYVRCANNTVTSEPGFDRVSYFTILVTTSYVPLSLTGATCSAC